MNTIEAIKTRTSANNFDDTKKLTQLEINELVALAIESPSSYNIQHSRFLAFTDDADKIKLQGIAYGQQKVKDAAVVFIILGDQEAYKDIPAVFKSTVEAGHMDQKTVDMMDGMAIQAYGNNPQFARDEAIRSASLSSMTLMLAATEKGFVSGPMIGFDAAKLSEAYHIPARYIPAMMIVVGYAAPGNWPRKVRYQASELLFMNGNVDGLAK